jgi:hypothetical protein
MMNCSNCDSDRTPIRRAGLCAKCRYWHDKRAGLQKELAANNSALSWQRRSSLRYKIREADRVLAEYAWRETQLQDQDVDPSAVAALAYSVAAKCRSEVAADLESQLAMQTPEARHCLFSILLGIVENTPSRLPRLHTFEAPSRGKCFDAWSDWAGDYWRSIHRG